MASTTEIKSYLAHWFQLGKKLIWRNGEAELLPQKILQGDGYAPEFEACWQQIISIGGKDCYLVGTNVTVKEMLTPTWQIQQCARCALPVPILDLGTQPLECVCNDLDNWPNSELPPPHSPLNERSRLSNISQRLKSLNETHPSKK